MASKNKQNQQRLKKIIRNSTIVLILALAFFVRTYKLNTPLADWHSWRQVDTASVALEYTKNGIDLLRPRYLDLSNIPSGMENPEGYRMVEFPLVSGFVAFLHNVIPTDIQIHVLYRLVSITFSLGSTYLIYKIVNLFKDQKTAILASFIFAVLPFNIFYSRAVLPEVSLVFFSLLQIYSISAFFMSKKQTLFNPNFWTGAVSGAIALLIKPYALVFVLPLLYLGFKTNGIKLLKDPKLYIFTAISLSPFMFWRYWIQQFPEGIPAYIWLLNGNNIRFKGAFFRWIFAERIGKLILGYWGLVLFGFGIHKKSKNLFFPLWLISILIYIFTFATGNVQHDYYQIITIPIIAIYIAKGMTYLLDQKSIFSTSLLVFATTFMLAFSWYEIRGFFNINNPAIVKAGQYIDQNTPKDSLVIAPYQGDTAFLYQTNRKGWPIGGSISQRIDQGADYYVTTSLDDEAKLLMDTYRVETSQDEFTVIKLFPIEQNNQNNQADGV